MLPAEIMEFILTAKREVHANKDPAFILLVLKLFLLIFSPVYS